MAFYVYILASRKNGTLYVGSTENLTVRISQHKQHLRPGFTSRYGVDLLVWFEVHDTREGGVPARTVHQGMETGLEGPADREGQFGMAGSV